MEGPTPVQSQTILESRERVAAQEASGRIMVGPEGFEKPVDVIRVSRTRAEVVPVAGKLRYIDVEEAARQATGCNARATPEVYAAANNKPTQLLTNADYQLFDYRLPVDLSC